VDSINDKFSTAFDRKLALVASQISDSIPVDIGCAGEIHIKEDEDYEKWAIEIFVKFRDKDELQRLNAQTQSGGVSYFLFPRLALTYGPVGTGTEYHYVSHEFDRPCAVTIFPRG
jgi:hypothetical protein